MVDKSNNEKFAFKVGRWLAKKELDHQTEVEIKADDSHNENDLQTKSDFEFYLKFKKIIIKMLTELSITCILTTRSLTIL